MHIGLDIDGVILDFERQMHYYAEMYDLLVLGKEGIVHKEEFSYLNQYDWTEEERKVFIRDYLIKGTINTPLMIGAKEIICLFHDLHYQTSIITARGSLNEKTITCVRNRLNREGICVGNVYYKVEDKVEMCKKLNIDIMIEDTPSICGALSKNDVFTLYLRDKKSKVVEKSEHLKEVNNWGEILREVLNKSNNEEDIVTCQKIMKKIM